LGDLQIIEKGGRTGVRGRQKRRPMITKKLGFIWGLLGEAKSRRNHGTNKRKKAKLGGGGPPYAGGEDRKNTTCFSMKGKRGDGEKKTIDAPRERRGKTRASTTTGVISGGLRWGGRWGRGEECSGGAHKTKGRAIRNSPQGKGRATKVAGHPSFQKRQLHCWCKRQKGPTTTTPSWLCANCQLRRG